MSTRAIFIFLLFAAIVPQQLARGASGTIENNKGRNDGGPACVLKALNVLGENFTVSGEMLRLNLSKRAVQLPEAVAKILQNVDSVSKTGDKVVVTNGAAMTIKAVAHLDKTITFTMISVDGKLALRDIEGVSIGIGLLKKKITNYRP